MKPKKIDRKKVDSVVQFPREDCECLQRLFVEVLAVGNERRECLRVSVVAIEKLRGRYAEVFADVKEAGHRRKRTTVFDVVDVAGVLSDGQAHIPRGNALALAQLGQPFSKLFLVHVASPLTLYTIKEE